MNEQSAENDAAWGRIGPINAEARRPRMTDPAETCGKCGSADLRTRANGWVTCRDCEKARGRARKDRRHRERGDRCGCGTDAVSLDPAEVVVHNWGGGSCRIAPADTGGAS